MTKAKQAKRHLELAGKLANRLHVMTGVGPATYSVSDMEYGEIATALRRLAEIDSRSSVQALIDELRDQLPEVGLTLRVYENGGFTLSAWKSDGSVHEVVLLEEAKTPDEALTLLRQRLGLEGEQNG